MNNNSTMLPPAYTSSEIEKIIFTTGLTLLSLLTIFGNTLVMTSFLLYRPLRTHTNYFIVSLSLSDILVAVISMPIWITFILLNNKFSIFEWKLLKAWTSIDILTGVASIMNLTAVSVDRYIHITLPLKHSRRITRRNVQAAIVFIWTFSLALALMKGLHWNWKRPIYEMLIACISFVIPLFVILVCYVNIYKAVMNQRKHFTHQHFKVASMKVRKSFNNKMKNEMKAVKTIAFVVLGFFICWCPFFVLNLFNAWCLYYTPDNDVCKPDRKLVTLVKVLHYTNSAINPIIYACFNREFRKGFNVVLYRKLSNQNQDVFSSIIRRASMGIVSNNAESLTPITRRERSQTVEHLLRPSPQPGINSRTPNIQLLIKHGLN